LTLIALIAAAEKLWPQSSLGNRLDLPGRHALHGHLGARRHQRLLGALVALEQLGREAAGPILRRPQLQLADPGDQGAVVVAAALAKACRRPRALLGANCPSVISASKSSCRIVWINGRRKSRSAASSAFTSSSVGLSSPRGMVCILLGDVEHHPHTMTPPLRLFAEPSVHDPQAAPPSSPCRTAPSAHPALPHPAAARLSGTRIPTVAWTSQGKGEWRVVNARLDGTHAAAQLSLADGLVDGGTGRNRQLENIAVLIDRAAFARLLGDL
jgi:hypothetical protein